ncbi:MAG TPA: 2Fe-2S iron-sulfur cluster binding domain-containing protein [Pseudobdellovibrionaceae bacterium]|nr:2Fe-2S iron-sulfur cluster binding domain-containing protein [Pseudobdellovibrionaceae bacterium]
MKVKFLPEGKEIEITPEKTLLQAALENGIDVKSICKGKLICAECRVKVVEGESNLLPPSKAELNLIGTAWQLDSRRFACQMHCFGDVTVDLTEQIQRAESAKKNIRGYKSSRPVTESVAVVDTMLLNEKIEIPDEAPRKEKEGRSQGSQGRSSGNQSSKQQGEGQSQGQGGGKRRRRRR